MSWIAVDLDGTLAEHPSTEFVPTIIGPPIPAMVDRVKAWLARGIEVRVFTARVASSGDPVWGDVAAITEAIQAWCVEHIGVALPVTATKDYQMWELWDDRAVQVLTNTGTPATEVLRSLMTELILHYVGHNPDTCSGEAPCTCGLDTLANRCAPFLLPVA
jgi:hypothetical protein